MNNIIGLRTGSAEQRQLDWNNMRNALSYVHHEKHLRDDSFAVAREKCSELLKDIKAKHRIGIR